MNQPTSLYLTSLCDVEWQNTEKFDFPSAFIEHWLLEQGSLSRRLAKHCDTLTVELINQQSLPSSVLSAQERAALGDQACLLREVILKGDGVPWVLGRTLIPERSLVDQSHDFTQQGEIPLGLTVFAAERVERDALVVGWVTVERSPLLARRSRLWMNHKPMLVAELFLPTAPMYCKE